MRTRWMVLFVGMAVAFTACSKGSGHGVAPLGAANVASPGSGASPVAPAIPAAPTARELLVVGSASGASVIDAQTGSQVFAGSGVPALGDWSVLVTATDQGGATLVDVTRDASGESVGTARVTGDLAIRTVSSDGSRVALMAPLPAGTGRWTPQDRATTTIVVADPMGNEKPQRFHLKGNYEPEAFSGDDTALFLIKYVPAIDPVAYRVTRLDLDEGEVYPVFGRLKSPVETMSGTRLMQLPSPAGDRLYTLYTSQPASYALEYDPMQAKAGQPVAFVHTLSLDEGWAQCIGLPRALWAGDPVHEALALSPDGRSLYVVDTKRGVVAVMNTLKLKVVRMARVDFSALGAGFGGGGAQAHAAAGPGGRTLVVAAGSRLVVLRTATMRPEAVWNASGTVSAVGFGHDGRSLYLALPGRVEELDPATGDRVRTFGLPGTRAIDYVGALAG